MQHLQKPLPVDATLEKVKLLQGAFACLLLISVCRADDQPPPVTAEPAVVLEQPAPDVDPIGVHPLFGAEVPKGVYKPLTRQQRLELYMRQTFTTPNPWLRTSISAGMSQIQGRNYSWGGGVEGYSRRYASQYATYVIRNSFLSMGAWGLGHDTRYVQAESHNPFARVGHAVMQNFLTVNRNGATVVNISRVLSGYAAGMIATSWHSNSKWSAQGLRFGNEQIIYGGVFNIGREFAPEIDHLIKRVFHAKH